MSIPSKSVSIPSSSDNPFNEKAFNDIDREIENHLAAILVLKNQRNAIVPIAKLPPELHCYIFDFVRQVTRGGSLIWIRLSHVCRYWRQLMINTPTFWTVLPLQYLHWTHEMLIRSKTASLTVDSSKCTVSPPSLLENIISNHTSRIRILNIVLRRTDALRLFEMFPNSAPTLESFVLTVIPDRSFVITPDLKRLPYPLGETPRIQRLELGGIKIDWDTHLGSTLTILKLSDTDVPTQTQFWGALERMPLLETLDLANCLPPVTNAPFSENKSHFKNLKTLNVLSSAAEAEHFLKGISFPKSTCIHITCFQGNASTFTGITLLLGSHFQNHKTAIRYLDVELEQGQRRLSFSGSCSLPKGLYQLHPPNKFDLDFSWDDTSYKGEDVLRGIFNSFRFNSVKHLQITDGLDQISTQKVVETFGSLPRLEKVQGNLGPKFVLAMQQTLPTPTPNSSGQARPSFPKLRTIFLDEASFTDFYAPSDLGDLSINALLDCFIWRYEHGAEIYTLEIESCVRVSGRDVSLLGEVVVDVHWDGEEIGFTDEDEDDDDDDDMDSDGFGFYDDPDFDDDVYGDPSMFW